MKKNIILMIIFIVFDYSNGSGQNQDSSKFQEDIDQFFAEKVDQGASMNLPKIPTGLKLEMMDAETREVYLAALREHYSYQLSGYQHRRKVFDWQLFSSKVTFYIVILIVLSGIYFSGVQFHSSLKKTPKEQVNEEAKVTQISASVEGIKVSSPVLGVIILSISLLFFYLYLVYVYPIDELF